MGTTPTNIRAAIYCRISKDKTGLRAGVGRQREDCQALAQRLGWPIVGIYVDNDISAYSGKRRPEYQQLSEAVERGTINAVIAWHPDRLHRRSAELETWLDLVGDNVQHATCQAGLWDLSTPSGRMTARILGAVGQHESEHKSERVRAAKAVDARNGRFNGGIRCYGYEPDGMTIRESEAVEIRALADAIVRGVSLRSLARDLNQRGIPTTTGSAPWSQPKLRSVMLSPRLAGLRAHRERDDNGTTVTKLYRGAWPAIVDATAYEAMRAILEDPERARGPRMGRVPTALGTGLFVCGVCKQPTMRRAKATGGWPIYRCGGAGYGGRHVSRHADTLDAFVTDALIARLSEPGFVQAMVDRVSAKGNANQAGLVAEREEIRSALDELAKASESGSVTTALAIPISKADNGTHETGRRDQAPVGAGGAQSPLAALIGAKDIAAAWHAQSLPVQRAILDAVVTVTVNPGKRGPLFDAASIGLDYH